MEIIRFTKDKIQDVLEYELSLRKEESWGWKIDKDYIDNVTKSFDDSKFNNSISFLAYIDNKVVGRIDSCLICSHFDGSTKAYLDWICVLKDYRHNGVGQKLMETLRRVLKQEYNVDTLIGLIASNDEAQRFYKSLKNSLIRDQGIWIDC